MRSNFSGRSRKRRSSRVLKFFLLLGMFSVGLLFAFESRYASMRLRSITVTPPDILPEHAVFGTITSLQERFWPAFFFSSDRYLKNLERYYPVKLKMEYGGWGNFLIRAAMRVPVFTMRWNGVSWYVSADGCVWRTTLPLNARLGLKKMRAAELIWDKNRIMPIDVANAVGNIYDSSLPVDMILSWYDALDALGWSDSAAYIKAGFSEGRPVVKITFRGGAGMIFNEDCREWGTVGAAVKKIYPDISEISSDMFIDTTYNGKILVRHE